MKDSSYLFEGWIACNFDFWSVVFVFNPISTGGGGVFSTPCPVNGSELHNGTR